MTSIRYTLAAMMLLSMALFTTGADAAPSSPVTANSVLQPTISIVFPADLSVINQNDEFFVEVHVNDVTNMLGVALDFSWDPAGNVEHISSEGGAFITTSGLLILPTPSAGNVNLGISRPFAAGGVSGSGAVAKIKLKMLAANGVQTSLSLNNATWVDAATGANNTFTSGASGETTDITTGDPINPTGQPTISLVIPDEVGGVPQIPANQNDEFIVEVHVNDVTNMLGVAFDFTWNDAANLEHISSEGGAFITTSGLLILPTPSAGNVNLGISRPFAAGGVSGSGAVARIKLKMLAANGVQTSLSLNNATWVDAATGANNTFTAAGSEAITTDTEGETEVPEAFAVHSNYPNPFNPATSLVFDLNEPAEVRVEITDMAGRLVRVIPAQPIAAGAQRTINVNVEDLASGTYLYRLIARGATAVKVGTGRMVLLK